MGEEDRLITRVMYCRRVYFVDVNNINTKESHTLMSQIYQNVEEVS